jgi:hypothetical protein
MHKLGPCDAPNEECPWWCERIRELEANIVQLLRDNTKLTRGRER